MAKNLPGQADHAADAPSWLDSLPMRTLVQQAGFDVGLALLLVVHDVAADPAGGVQWGIVVASLVKTAIVTLTSSIMRQARPPHPPQGA